MSGEDLAATVLFHELPIPLPVDGLTKIATRLRSSRTTRGAKHEAVVRLAIGGQIMIVRRPIDEEVRLPTRWGDLWERSDNGLICSWARGIEKARENPPLSARALIGELPPLAWKGGGDKPIKLGRRIGSYHYLATWQGLRGEDLHIDTEAEVSLTCVKTGVVVAFTADLQALASSAAEDQTQ